MKKFTDSLLWQALLLPLSIGCGTLLFFCLPFICVVLVMILSNNSGPYTKLSKYPKILKKLPDPIRAHFPKAIRPDPERVRLYYYDSSHQMGQGGIGRVELWMKLDQGETDRLFNEFEKQSLSGKSFGSDNRPGGFFLVNGATASSWPPPWPPARDVRQLDPLPPDFKILKLDNGDLGMWFRGVAFSKKRNEIIYYGGYAWSS